MSSVVDIVDGAAIHVAQAQGIDINLDAFLLKDVVALFGLSIVKGHSVGKSGATALFDEQAQAERLAKRKAELEDARLLSQMAKVQHLPYLPAQDEFVFSTDEIDSYTARHHRLRLAKKEEFKYMEHFHLLELPEAA